MTTATKAGGAVLPVVGYRINTGHGNHLSEGLSESQKAFLWAGKPAWRELTYREPAQATIDELRAEVERLTRERDGLRAARFAYASEFPLNADGEPDIGSIHANIRALKAKQINVDAVMRLIVDFVYHFNSFALRPTPEGNCALNAAREALRASLLGDGGTL